jgi:hypothetical protein
VTEGFTIGDRQEGQSQANVPAVRSAYTSPSNIDLRVMLQLRWYQIEFWGSDSE